MDFAGTVLPEEIGKRILIGTKRNSPTIGRDFGKMHLNGPG